MKIIDYSCYDNFTVKSETENISNIVDKLIRLTAKITERYAGDIFYDIHTLFNFIEEKYPHDKIVFFREDGVSTFKTEMVEKDNRHILCNDYIQTWRLTYDPKTTTTVLKRVELRKEV